MRWLSRKLMVSDMEIQLKRTYFKDGTNGVIWYHGTKICECIELPWKENRRQVSCIPEGRYRIATRIYPGYGKRMVVLGVPNRDGILIHAANNANEELKGCIAPVTKATAPGMGIYSRVALERLEDLVIPVVDAREAVWMVVGPHPNPSPEERGF